MSWMDDVRAILPGSMGPPSMSPEQFFHAVMLALGPIPQGGLTQYDINLSKPLSEFVREYDRLRRQLCPGCYTEQYYTQTDRPYSAGAYRHWYNQQEQQQP